MAASLSFTMGNETEFASSASNSSKSAITMATSPVVAALKPAAPVSATPKRPGFGDHARKLEISSSFSTAKAWAESEIKTKLNIVTRPVHMFASKGDIRVPPTGYSKNGDVVAQERTTEVVMSFGGVDKRMQDAISPQAAAVFLAPPPWDRNAKPAGFIIPKQIKVITVSSTFPVPGIVRLECSEPGFECTRFNNLVTGSGQTGLAPVFPGRGVANVMDGGSGYELHEDDEERAMSVHHELFGSSWQTLCAQEVGPFGAVFKAGSGEWMVMVASSIGSAMAQYWTGLAQRHIVLLKAPANPDETSSSAAPAEYPAYKLSSQPTTDLSPSTFPNYDTLKKFIEDGIVTLNSLAVDPRNLAFAFEEMTPNSYDSVGVPKNGNIESILLLSKAAQPGAVQAAMDNAAYGAWIRISITYRFVAVKR